MPLPDDFKFSDIPAIQAEGERRAVVMFGADWKQDCALALDGKDAAIVLGNKSLVFGHGVLVFGSGEPDLFLKASEGGAEDDLADGSPAIITFYESGIVKETTRMWCRWPADGADGSPAHVKYHSNGSVKEVRYWNAALKDTESLAQTFYAEDGAVTGGASAAKGDLSAEETTKMIKAVQVARVAALLAKADQSVIPIGLPLPKAKGK